MINLTNKDKIKFNITENSIETIIQEKINSKSYVVLLFVMLISGYNIYTMQVMGIVFGLVFSCFVIYLVLGQKQHFVIFPNEYYASTKSSYGQIDTIYWNDEYLFDYSKTFNNNNKLIEIELFTKCIYDNNQIGIVKFTDLETFNTFKHTFNKNFEAFKFE